MWMRLSSSSGRLRAWCCSGGAVPVQAIRLPFVKCSLFVFPDDTCTCAHAAVPGGPRFAFHNISQHTHPPAAAANLLTCTSKVCHSVAPNAHHTAGRKEQGSWARPRNHPLHVGPLVVCQDTLNAGTWSSCEMHSAGQLWKPTRARRGSRFYSIDA